MAMFTSPSGGLRSRPIVIIASVCVFVCLSAHISRKPHIQLQTITNFLCLLIVAVVRFASGGIAIRLCRAYFRFCGWRHLFILWAI